MAVRPKVNPAPRGDTARSEREIEALIERGGAPTSAANGDPEAAKLTVRLDPAMIRRIDEARARRPVRLSRNQWIIEAIHGHLENGGDNHTGRS
jgi:hypothetical protein